ncbi:MAG TPA: hypothetical protein VFT19_13045 [Solirubrobacterales bacterium]|nr:hypothetical protein [Solirubrobacterales bacterium]
MIRDNDAQQPSTALAAACATELPQPASPMAVFLAISEATR